MKGRALVAFMAAIAASCGAPLMRLPSGPGTAISSELAATVLEGATAACRRIRTLTAEIGVSGTAGGHRMRGRLLAGVAAPASARLEAVAPFGQPMFIFTATGDDATLLLPRDRRVLEHAPPGEVLDAVAGVPLDAADLFLTLTGCAPEAPAVEGVAIGEDWRVLTAGSAQGRRTAYVRRDAIDQPWRLVAVVRAGGTGPDWRAEYRDHQGGLPRSIRLAGADSSAPDGRFNITLALSQVETNTTLDAQAFSVQIPPDTDPISLDELRRSSPLAPRADAP